MFSMGFGLYSSILLVNNCGLDRVRFRFKDDHVTSSLNANNKLKNSTLGEFLGSDRGISAVCECLLKVRAFA